MQICHDLRMENKLPPNIFKRYSKSHGREVYGIDIRFSHKRIRKGGFLTLEQAQEAVSLYKNEILLKEIGLADKSINNLTLTKDWKKSDLAEHMKSCSMGAIGELLVCADLLKYGLDVYRSVTSVGIFDLVISDGETLMRVEVKCARRGVKNCKPRYSIRPGQRKRHDVLALVFLDEGVIEYVPDISEWFQP